MAAVKKVYYILKTCFVEVSFQQLYSHVQGQIFTKYCLLLVKLINKMRTYSEISSTFCRGRPRFLFGIWLLNCWFLSCLCQNIIKWFSISVYRFIHCSVQCSTFADWNRKWLFCLERRRKYLAVWIHNLLLAMRDIRTNHRRVCGLHMRSTRVRVVPKQRPRQWSESGWSDFEVFSRAFLQRSTTT